MDPPPVRKLHTFPQGITFNVDERFEPEKVIGTGAYGMVCAALDKVTKKRFAIKKVKGAFQIQVITKRTLREILLLRHFYAHDNIISVLTILQPPPDPKDYSDVYLVMDLQESDLHRIIHSQQPLTEEHLRYFLYQTLRGLK